MKSIYKAMEQNWETYCLMAGIAIIEEFSKPKKHPQIKNGITFYCYQAIRLKMKDKKTIDRWIEITRVWEKKLNQKFITNYFKEAHKEKDQYLVYFLPNWTYHILKEVKHFPSKCTDYLYYERIINWKKSNSQYILSRKKIENMKNSPSKYYKLLNNKYLATGAFIVSFDLEFRGAFSGCLDLCMSERYKDFLEFMLSIANKFNWSTRNILFPVSVEYSRSIGIKASPQFNFNLKINKLEEIYVAGPLLDEEKDKFLRYHINRSKNYISNGGSKETKYKILNYLKENKEAITRDIHFISGVGVDVVLNHLHNLKNKGLVNNERIGKGYIWRIENAN